MKLPSIEFNIDPRDRLAAKLSLIPGLGQLYKGHVLEGVSIFLLGGLILAWAGMIALLGYAFHHLLTLLGLNDEILRWTLLLIGVTQVVLPLLLFFLVEILEAFLETDRRHVKANSP